MKILTLFLLLLSSLLMTACGGGAGGTGSDNSQSVNLQEKWTSPSDRFNCHPSHQAISVLIKAPQSTSLLNLFLQT